MRQMLLGVALLTALPGAALAWRAQNGHQVHDLGQGVFEVVGRAGSGAQDYWCGAGDYARSVLGVAAAQRIFLWAPVGPSASSAGKRAVQFALTAPKGADTTPGLSLSVKRVGDNLSASMAQQYCYGGKFDSFPWSMRP
ncbi:hypothetical protein [Pseudodonghicola flavimaris]|uniref:Uncharacterized protein n=1 Tax=Pseudodonghicola flavimaris TaxID=3050036 RepID=A0ABT7F4D9_9RHOB|nr:hypothetical protein [Pseudodonghicola flavimaris]MDK3019466.1 hypothetical protein [Pseudodonghicola flavimaris]